MILPRVCWSIFLCLALGPTPKAQAQVTVDDESYQNILISFAPNTPEEDGEAIAGEIRDQLESTSRILHKAIGIPIASATFLLPPSWSTDTWKDITVVPASSEQTARRPDIILDITDDSPFTKQPVALQHGGCGVPGHQIILNLNFLGVFMDYPEGKLLAREWLKYRYGVFEENGFMGDPLYPAYYKIPGKSEIKITECTNSKVTYIFKQPLIGDVCDMNSSGLFGYCRVYPDEKSGGNVTSSLMYFHQDLPKMEHICGKDGHPHHGTARNKQNALCNGRSIWDVIQSSDDFKKVQRKPVNAVPRSIRFSYIQESIPRFVVLLENSDNLHEKRESIRFALKRFYYDLPPKSKLAIYTYNSDVSGVLPYTTLPAKERSDFGIIADFGSPATGIRPSIGLAKAAQILLLNNEKGKGKILLITASPLDKMPEFPENLKESGICLRVLRFTDKDASVDKSYEALKDSFSCFTQEPLQISFEAVVLFNSLSHFLRNDVPRFNEDFEIKTVASGNMSAQNPVTISRDATSEMYTLWLNRVLGSASIECTAGDAAVELKPGITATDIASFTFAPMDTDVTCRLGSARQSPALTQIQMTTKKGQYFDFDIWIHDVSTENEQLPIIIYAKIYFGGYPVKYASVTTVVTSGTNQVNVNMLDNGRGDPDVTQYDGIYSGCFTSFLEAGDYQISVKMSDNEGEAKIGKAGTSLVPDACCGSKINSKDVDVPAFRMNELTVYTAKNKRPKDGYPPSKVLDLQAKIFPSSNKVVLTWTAPGGEKAAGYILKLFENRNDVVTKFDTTGRELNVSSKVPGDTGKVGGFVIPFKDLDEDTTYFAAIRSRNEFNKLSEVSNVAEFVPRQEKITSVDEVSSTPESTTGHKVEERDQPQNSKTIGIVLGVLGGIAVLCILVYLGYYFFVKKPRQN